MLFLIVISHILSKPLKQECDSSFLEGGNKAILVELFAGIEDLIGSKARIEVQVF